MNYRRPLYAGGQVPFAGAVNNKSSFRFRYRPPDVFATTVPRALLPYGHGSREERCDSNSRFFVFRRTTRARVSLGTDFPSMSITWILTFRNSRLRKRTPRSFSVRTVVDRFMRRRRDEIIIGWYIKYIERCYYTCDEVY